MNRYQIDAGIEGEYEPGSRGRVLRNKLGIRSMRQMDQAEASALLEVQRRYLSTVTVQTKFTCEFIRRMHCDWLREIYEWAGRYRTVEVSKGTFTWPPAHLVSQNMEAFEAKKLRRLTPCRHSEIQLVSLGLAEVQAEFLMVHPFREGNGRMARWISNLMAMQAGYPALDYGFTGRGGKRRGEQYLAAVVRGYSEDYLPLAGFLSEALRRGVLRAGREESFRPRAPSK
jgi:cell filamentation protein